MSQPEDADIRLEKLVDLIVQLASGDLTARMIPSPARDNVDAVITGINLLAGELQDIHADLERRVGERTRQLELVKGELEHLAMRDPLTGLANRTLLNTRLEMAVADQRPGGIPPSVLLIDLDEFKTINDSLGHNAGDTVLIQVARRLQHLAPPGSTVARLGGDEFAVLVLEASPAQALEVSARALHALGAPYLINGRTLNAGASVGLRLGQAHCTGDLLLRDADTAMYAAKADGRGNVKVYHPSMHAAVQQRLDLASALAAAIRDDQLFLTFEAMMDLADGSLLGMEALVRWQHPDRGVLTAADFIPIAEGTGLIIDLGRWVIRRAVAQLAHWQSRQPAGQRFQLHVNLSPLELRRPDLAPFILGTLHAQHVSARRLVIELPEAALMSTGGTGRKNLSALRAADVGIAIDDFGVGHSSIRSLRRLPVDTVKVDRSLTNDIAGGTSRTFLQAVLRLIDSAGLCAIVEGVDTAQQVKMLQEMNCRYAQGAYFDPPIEATGLLPGVRSAAAAGPGDDTLIP